MMDKPIHHEANPDLSGRPAGRGTAAPRGGSRRVRHRQREATEGLTRSLRWIVIDEQIARHAGALSRTWRRSHLLATPDLIIAATAQELESDLATANTRHFPMFEGITPPYGSR